MKIKTTFFLLLVLITHASISQTNQQVSVQGVWHGTSTYLNVNYPITIELQDKGDTITGVVTSSRKDSTEYYKYTIEGVKKGQKLYLFGTSVISSKGLFWCMPRLDLSLVTVNGQSLIEGRWKPNLKKGGCIIGSGRVSVVKEIKHQQVVLADNTSLKTTSNDAFTSGMVKGLKQRQYHALILGVNDYNDESMPDLDNPVKDGQRLISILNNLYSFQKEDITFLKNPTRSEILDAMQRLGDELDSQDNVLIFYAGHGIWDEKLGQGYWLPSDASRDSKSNWISNSTIRDYIKSIKTQHTLLISDACFSGGLLKERSVGRAMMNLYKMPSRKAITSGTLTTVPDKSVFIDYLIKYLQENDKPLISTDELFYQTKISVINNSPSNQIPQYGPIHQAKDEGGEFVFLRVEK